MDIGGSKAQSGLVILVLALIAGGLAYGAAETTRITVEAEYFADSRIDEQGLIRGRFPIERPVRPFAKLAARLMDYAGDDDTLHIEARGIALGSLYDFMENRVRLRHLRYSGATLEGRVSLASKINGMTCSARFAGTVGAGKGGMVVGVWDYREAPHLAPFDKALEAPGSFAAALIAVISTVYGPAARTDSDFEAAQGAPLPAVACVTP